MIWFILSVVFLFLGFAVHKLKWYFLISGYNTMSREKKKNVNVAALGRLMGMFGYFNAGLFFLMACLDWLDIKSLITPILVIFVVSIVVFLIRAQRYDGNLFDEQGKLRKGAWKQFVVLGIVLGAVTIGIGILLYFSSQATNVVVGEDAIEITGIYGDRFQWDDIKRLELIQTLPTIEFRSNGSAVGSHLKGYFKTKELGSVKLFVDANLPPFILFECNKQIIIVNLETTEKTLKLFEEMKNEIK